MSSDNEVFNQKPNSPSMPPATQTPQNNEVPAELITLPSKGLLYPLGSPLSNEQSVEIRCMNATDENLLTSRALIKNGTVMTKLLKACLMNKMIDPDSMLSGDRNAVLIGLRVTGYGPDYVVKIECPECEKEFTNTFNLGRLKMKMLTENPIAPRI